jgi:hypothetical protein
MVPAMAGCMPGWSLTKFSADAVHPDPGQNSR